MALYPKYFERFGFDGTLENTNIWYDAIKRAFKPEKGTLKIKYLNNPDFGISGVDSFFVLVQKTDKLSQNLKHVIAIDAPETAAHMTVIDTHNIAVVDEHGLRATNMHMPYIANDYTLHPRNRAIRVMDVNLRQQYEFHVLRHYQVIDTPSGVMLKPLFVCGTIPFGNLNFGSDGENDIVEMAKELRITNFIYTPKFKRYDIINPRFFVLRSNKANIYALASAMLDKYFGHFINLTGIQTISEVEEFQFSKDVGVDINEDVVLNDKYEYPLSFNDFSIESIIDERGIHIIENLDQIYDFMSASQLKSIVLDRKSKEKEKKERKAKKNGGDEEQKFRDDD